MVIGTNSLYAYEAHAGVFLDGPLLATEDVDFLWDVRPRLTLLTGDRSRKLGMIDILQKVDRSFRVLQPNGYRAGNRGGYLVDLIKAFDVVMWRRLVR